MKKDKKAFLEVDSIEPVYSNDGFCSTLTRLGGIKVWIGNTGHFFPCDTFTVCDPDVVREDGHQQVVALMKELGKMGPEVNMKLFGYRMLYDIITRLSYDEIVEKLDSWKKEREKIHVRDEVYNKALGANFVITKIYTPCDGDVIVNGLKKDGTAIKGLLLSNVKKTGVHVDDLDSYLEV